ncbi:unnamed protein product [Amoebophrya sp. A25]|nr:unnamed protein product [Amoebophrya sp. A25]|eukprot:GSA25T00016324001.1
MKKLASSLAAEFPVPRSLAKFRNRTQAQNGFLQWQLRDVDLSDKRQRIGVTSSLFALPSGTKGRLELSWATPSEHGKLRFWRETHGGQQHSQPSMKVRVNGQTFNSIEEAEISKLVRNDEGTMVLDSLDVDLLEEAASRDVEPKTETGRRRATGEDLTTEQSVEVIGDLAAVWRVRWPGLLGRRDSGSGINLEDLFGETPSASSSMSGCAADQGSKVLSGGASTPATASSSARTSSSSSSSSSSSAHSPSPSSVKIASNQQYCKPGPASGSQAFRFNIPFLSQRAASSQAEGGTRSSSTSLREPLVSTPFRLFHVGLGDFWLEFLPMHPHRNFGTLFFRLGYPDLAVRATLSVGSSFRKSVVVTGRSALEEDLEKDACLQVNFDVADAWDTANSGLSFKVELEEILNLPPKLRDLTRN